MPREAILAALEEVAPRAVSTRGDTPLVFLRRGPAGNDPTCEDPAISSDHAEQWDWRAFAPHAFGDVATADSASSARPASYEMYHAARAHRSFILGGDHRRGDPGSRCNRTPSARAPPATSAGESYLRRTAPARRPHAARSRLRPQRNNVGRGGNDGRSGVHPRACLADVARSSDVSRSPCSKNKSPSTSPGVKPCPQSLPFLRPRSISPRSRPASKPPGPRATMPSWARRCRSSARTCAKRSTCAPARACSTSPPATAMPRLPPRAAGAT